MTPAPADSLLAAFRRLTDPRHRRGIRHPFPGLLATIFLGLLSRQPDFASIARWARRHWPALKDAFGLTRRYAPHETTYSRLAATFSVEEFRAALAGWLARVLADGPAAAAVDGKTSKQAATRSTSSTCSPTRPGCAWRTGRSGTGRRRSRRCSRPTSTTCSPPGRRCGC